MLTPKELKPLLTLARAASMQIGIKISECCVLVVKDVPPHVLTRRVFRLPTSAAPAFAAERVAASMDGAPTALKVVVLDESTDSVHVINVDVELHGLLDTIP